jgi:hypothetical protein
MRFSIPYSRVQHGIFVHNPTLLNYHAAYANCSFATLEFWQGTRLLHSIGISFATLEFWQETLLHSIGDLESGPCERGMSGSIGLCSLVC